MSIPDRTLRASAWTVTGLLLVMLAVRVPIYLAHPSDEVGVFEAFSFIVVIVMFPVTGALILRRQPRNSFGWLLQGIGLIWLVAAFTDNYATYALYVNPGSLPGATLAAGINAVIWAPAVGMMGTFLILLFPDGHLPSPRWRPVAWLSAGTMVGLLVVMLLTPGPIEFGSESVGANPIGWEAARPVLHVLLAILLTIFPLCIVACAVALVRRFRRSHGIERQQLKWLATAAAVVALLVLASFTAPVLVDRVTTSAQPPDWLGVVDQLGFLSFVLLPAAIGVAVLRYRLYDIDVVIKRTLVYATLTAILAGVYLASVLVLQLLLNPLTSQSDLAVAGSTLAVAALFGPARRRIQQTVDRRFYRSRYDAVRTVDMFAARLRGELDLDAVGADLRAAVNHTMQPEHVSLWVRP